MMNFTPLYSSSSGNSFHIETNKANILIDVGVSYKGINDGLKSIEKDIKDVSAVLITHEHVDHIKALPLFCRKNSIPIYACGKTADYLSEQLKEKNIECNIIKTKYGQPFKIKDLEVMPFETSHDAVMPCGYRLETKDTTMTYATDLGYVSDEVYEYLDNSNFVVLESNYDESMLDFGKYPYMIKRRIKSVNGHLSNDDSAHVISKLAKSGQTEFLLAHLSENNNDKNIALNTINNTLLLNDIDPDSLNIQVASKSILKKVETLC